jgi:hypothetical protein
MVCREGSWGWWKAALLIQLLRKLERFAILPPKRFLRAPFASADRGLAHPMPTDETTRRRVDQLRQEIAVIREQNLDYLHSKLRSADQLKRHEKRELRLVQILNELSTLSSK